MKKKKNELDNDIKLILGLITACALSILMAGLVLLFFC